MGLCCSNPTEIPSSKSENHLQNTLQRIIKENLDCQDFRLLCDFDKGNINKPFLSIGDTEVNALAFAIVNNDLDLIKYLHTKLGASFEQTEILLARQNSSIFDLIISSYSQEVLEYCLPIYLKFDRLIEIGEIDYTINFTSLSIPNPIKHIHPMRRATEKNSVPFLSYIISYFKGQQIPKDFDINDIDDDTGENCALIACRSGDLNLLVFLYKMNANFFVKNRNNENAIQVAMTYNQKIDEQLCYSVLVFLIDIVGIDVTDNYEENLLLARDEVIIGYIEEKLLHAGIKSTKRQVEGKYDLDNSMYEQQVSKTFHEVALSTISSIFGTEEFSIFSQITID
ncbi:hypothetical protein SteCoe_12390 [Stentor coeruleus]|uniref:DUF3447 domain-containing protein n=1 Tax=Stentor coeruleus TaxID=5963 RepID=A0A1R2CB14_9CILI|nr:hypothetical protein SteCoe_12390 [Stentor coeruleus]